MKKLTFLFIVSFLSLQGHLAFADDDEAIDAAQSVKIMANNPEAVIRFLFDPIPRAFGQPEFFTLTTPENSESFGQLVHEQKLDAAVRQGIGFRNWYLDTLKEGVSAPSYQYLTQFEGRARRRVLELLGLTRKTKADRTLKHLEAERLASYNVSTRYHLKLDTTAADITTHRFDSMSSEEAYYSYQRAYYSALHTETIAETTRRWNVREIQEQLVREIRTARSENFLAALQFATKINHTPNLKITTRDQKNILAGSPIASVNFALASEFERFDEVIIKETRSQRLDRLFGYFSMQRRSFDHGIAQDFYFPREFSPVWTSLSVTINYRDGRQAKISERNFSEWLNALRPADSLDQFAGKVHEKRFLIEASKRDALLGDLEQVVRDQSDEKVESLLKRLNDRLAIATHPTDDQMYTLTEELRANPEAVKDHLFNNILWSGWAVHPDFWRVKSASARTTGRRHFSQLFKNFDEPAKSATEAKSLKKAEKNELKLNRQRVATRRMRRLAIWSPWIIGASILAGGGYGAVELVKNYFEPPSISRSGLITKPLGGSSEYNMRQPEDNYIVPAGDSSGRSSENPAFQITAASDYGASHMPEYFNIADNGNLPREVLLDEDMFSEPSAVHEVKIDPSQTTFDLAIHGTLTMVADHHRIGVLSLPGYRISGIEVREPYGERIDSTWYRIYEVPNSGLTYLETASYDKIRYDVKYVKDTRPIYSPPEFKAMNKDILKELSAELRSFGATNLSDDLDRKIARSGDISVMDLSRVFYSSGFYTYREVGPNFISRWLHMTQKASTFEDYRKYLLNGDLYYQCTGSNSLFKDALNFYLLRLEKVRPGGASFEAMHIYGFRHDLSGTVTMEQGHQHTLLTDNKAERTYIELDATPVKMDPQAGAKKTSPRPQVPKEEVTRPTTEEKSPQAQDAEAPEEQAARKKTELPKQKDPKPVLVHAKVIALLPKVTTGRDLPREANQGPNSADGDSTHGAETDPRAIAFKAVDQAMKDLAKEVELEAPINPLFKQRGNFTGVNGLNAMAYGSIMRDLMGRKITARIALMRIVALKSHYRDFQIIGTRGEPAAYVKSLEPYLDKLVTQYGSIPLAIHALYIDYERKLEPYYLQIEKMIRLKGDSPLAFLLSDPWRRGVGSLSGLLSTLDYPSLLADEVEVAAEKCEVLLDEQPRAGGFFKRALGR